MGLTGSAATPPLLAVSGSDTELTRSQLTTLSSSRDVTDVRPVFLSGTRRIDVEATAADVLTHLRAASSGGAAGPAGPAIVLLATVLDATDIIDLTEAEADDIPAA